MGFRARHTYQLVLPDRLAGLEVEVRGRPLGEYFHGRDVTWENDDTVPQAKKAEKYRALYGEFIADVVSWNLEDDEEVTLPVTVEALLGADEEILTAVVYAWMNRQVKLPAPLSDSSGSGELSQVAQIPMETLSESQVS